jgi:hypothetical protein
MRGRDHLHSGPDRRVDSVVPLRRGNRQRHPQSRNRDHNLVDDVVDIPDPGHLLAPERSERVHALLEMLVQRRLRLAAPQLRGFRDGVVRLVQRQEVREDLRRVVQLRKGVDDGDGGVLGECLKK